MPNSSAHGYQLVALLHEGAENRVYMAEHPSLGRVALKVPVDPTYGFSLLEYEAGVLAGFDHPGMVKAVSQDGPLAYEWIEGQNLHQALEAEFEVPESLFWAVAVQLADILAALHGTGWAHLDLKPENMMVKRTGQLVLIDFGEARHHDFPRPEQDRPTGTLGYMAPENLRHEPLDARTDMFAYGALLYWIWAGQGPFDDERDGEVIKRTMRAEYVPLADARPCSDAMSQLVDACLQPTPAVRAPAQQILRAATKHTTLKDAKETIREWIGNRGVGETGTNPDR